MCHYANTWNLYSPRQSLSEDQSSINILQAKKTGNFKEKLKKYIRTERIPADFGQSSTKKSESGGDSSNQIPSRADGGNKDEQGT